MKTVVMEIFKQDIFGNDIVIEEFQLGHQDEDEDEDKTIAGEFEEESFELLQPQRQCGQLSQIDASGRINVLFRSENLTKCIFPTDEQFISELKKIRVQAEPSLIISLNSFRIASLIFTDNMNDTYLIQIAESLASTEAYLKRIKIIILIFFAVFLSLISIIGNGFVKKAFSPVKKIVEDVKRITVEDLNLRIKNIESKDEIGELVTTFNDLISRLQKSFNQVKQFSTDVSHELKTPLTILKGEIDVVLRQRRKTEEYVSTLESLYEEAGKLQNIINNLLLLSNLDSPEFNFSFTQIDLNEILLEVIENLHKLANSKNQTIEMQEIYPAIVQGEKYLLIRLFSNILENAIKYSPKKSKIILKMTSVGNNLSIAIYDNGIGIEKKYQEQIFDRFFRIDESRTNETGGSGLGLAIVQRIADLHTARIKLESDLEKGSTFTLIFLNDNK